MGPDGGHATSGGMAPAGGPAAQGGLTALDRWATPLFLLLLLVTLAFHIRSAREVRYFLRADEGYYLAYARAVAGAGAGMLPRLTEDYILTGSGVFPPPTRAGWIFPAGLALRFSGSDEPFAIGVLSTLFFCATVGATFAFLRRHARPRTALLAAAFVAVSPLLGGLARRLLQDSEVAFLTVAVAFSLHEALRGSSRRWAGLFGALLFWLLVSKELSVLIVPFLAGYAIYWRLRVDQSVDLAPLAVATAAAGTATAGVYLVLCGGPGGVLALARILAGSPSANSYAQAANSGPWFRYAVDLMSVSPVASILAIGYSFHFACSRENRSGSVQGFLLAFLLAVLLLFSVPLKNLRYVLSAEVPLRALAGFAVATLLDAWPRRAATVTLLLMAGAAMAYDVGLFHRIFVVEAIYDPVTAEILRALRMVPR